MSRVRKEPIEEMRQKKREEQRQHAQNDRFRIVNCSRTMTEANGAERVEGDAGQEITILDIEKHSTEARLTETETRGGVETAAPQPGQSTEHAVAAGSSHGDYVYDLYVPDVGQPELEWSEQFLENMLRFVPLEEDINLIFSYTYF